MTTAMERAYAVFHTKPITMRDVVQRSIGKRMRSVVPSRHDAYEIELRGTPDELRMVLHSLGDPELERYLEIGKEYSLLLVHGGLDMHEADGLTHYKVPYAELKLDEQKPVIVEIFAGDVRNAPDEIELEVDDFDDYV
jgi:hypothetical protein